MNNHTLAQVPRATQRAPAKMDTLRSRSGCNTQRHFGICFLIGLLTGLALVHGASAYEDQVDTREGENLTLKCRFNQQRQSANEFLYYWARSMGSSFENVAIGNIQLNTNYLLDFRPNDGTYDLLIKNASFSRDNGRFECRIKAVGTGADVHQEYYNITVLRLPEKPIIEAGLATVATEGKKHVLTCSSVGGSPAPTITWYREADTMPLAAHVTTTVLPTGGGAQQTQTRSTLALTPTRDDDEANFRCLVWNRAMDGTDVKRLETSVTLSVNYHPRVEIGPANPLQVERDSSATLKCIVDAKPVVTNVHWTHNGRFINADMVHTIHRVSVQDAGLYVCSADNGLGKLGEQEIALDVLTPPAVVIEAKTREANEGESVRIACSVSANPKPVTIEWLKEGEPSFRYAGDTLELLNIRADYAGTYVCRAVNIMMPYGENRVERIGNATVTLLIRHRPGRAVITPAHPVVHANSGVTLTCTASPPGWPVPQYRWYRDTDDGLISTKPILAQGSQYVIPRVHFGSEGGYHCQASNELGSGEVASVALVVHQAPQFLAKLQQHMTRQVADADFTVTCSAKGKPRPTIHWLKDGREISADLSMYDVQTNPIEGVNGMVTVQSVLRFAGKARPKGNELTSSDRGVYTCRYQNEVDAANSSMVLRIEHAPIVQHRYNKVAYDLRETARIECRVQAYPKPDFHWQFGKSSLGVSASSDGHYDVETSAESNDMYTSVLTVRRIGNADYGEYLCRVSNSLDTVRSHISLQPKGAPERPNNLESVDVGPTYVKLTWNSGFDGGLKNTKYFVSYRKVAMPAADGAPTDGCGANMVSNTDWMEFDCQQNNPCMVKHLDQHQAYLFKVKALNTKGASKSSNDIVVSTKVAHVPQPLEVNFDPATRSLGINVDATCLSLIAIAESMINENTPLVAWQIVETFPIVASGSRQTHRDTVIEHLVVARRSSVRSLSMPDDGFAAPPLEEEEEIEMRPRVRVKLCLNENHELCGEYTEAEVGLNLATGSALAAPTIIAIAVTSIVCLLLVMLLAFGRCRRTAAAKCDDSSLRSDALTAHQNQQNQEPPPYYPASALHSKSRDHSIDLALSKDETHKESLYGTQNDYVYYPQPTHQLTDSEWLNSGYPVNTNYAHSNNGGSVNSEDSVWQMKMSLAQQQQQQQQHHQLASDMALPAHQSALDLHHQQQHQHHHHHQQLQQQPHLQSNYGMDAGGLVYDMHGAGVSQYSQTALNDDDGTYSYQPNRSIGGGGVGGGSAMLLSGAGAGGTGNGATAHDEYSYNTMRSTHSRQHIGHLQPEQKPPQQQHHHDYAADAYAGGPVAASSVVGGGGVAGQMEPQIGVNSYFQV